MSEEENEKNEEAAKHADSPSKAYGVVLGSVKFFVLLYLVVIVAFMAGFTVLEPLFSILGAAILFGVSVTTYVLEAA